ncbi:hypothetical protein Peur_047726 [Populus x canadensis]
MILFWFLVLRMYLFESGHYSCRIFDGYQTEQASTLYEHSFQEHTLRVTDMVTEMARYTLLRSMLIAHLAKVTGCISSVHYLVTVRLLLA